MTAITLCDALVLCTSIFCASKFVCIIHMKIYPQLAIFQKALLKNSLRKYRTAINGTGPYIEYSMWPKTVESMGLINTKMDPFVFTRYLYTWLANDVSKSSMINSSGFFSCLNLPLILPRIKIPPFLYLTPWIN